MNRFFTAIASSVTLFSSSPASTTEPRILEPDGPWVMDYAQDSCRLFRMFGEDTDQTVVLMQQFRPGDEFAVTIAGKSLDSFRKSKTPGEDVVFRFGVAGGDIYRDASIGTFGKYEPALILTSLYVDPQPGQFSRDDKAAKYDWQAYEKPPVIAAKREASIHSISIGDDKGVRVKLNTGPMAKVFAAMDDCTDSLVRSWGLDPEAVKNQSLPPRPATNPGNWVTPRDYPIDAMTAGEQAVFFFRLMVSGTGKPVECHIQGQTQAENLNGVVCEAIMRRASFKPALDTSGHPVASFYTGAVRFQSSR